MFTPISWVISYKPYITAEIYRSNWIRGCKGQKRNQIDSLQQDLYGLLEFVISVQDDCTSPTEQVLQRVKLTNSSEIICHPCLTKHVSSLNLVHIFHAFWNLQPLSGVSRSSRCAQGLEARASAQHAETEGGVAPCLVENRWGVAENLFGSSIFNCIGEKLRGIPHIFRPFWSSNWDCSLQHLGAGGPAPFDLCPWEDIYNSWPRRGGAPSGQLWSLQAIKVAVTWRAWILLDILTWLVEPKMCLFHSIRFFFGRLKLRSGQTKIGSTVCWFISSASADSCPHRLMIEFPSLCFRSIWLDFGYHPGDCRSLSHYCHLYPFIALLALWTLWTGYGKSLTISGLMVISTL